MLRSKLSTIASAASALRRILCAFKLRLRVLKEPGTRCVVSPPHGQSHRWHPSETCTDSSHTEVGLETSKVVPSCVTSDAVVIRLYHARQK